MRTRRPARRALGRCERGVMSTRHLMELFAVIGVNHSIHSIGSNHMMRGPRGRSSAAEGPAFHLVEFHRSADDRGGVARPGSELLEDGLVVGGVVLGFGALLTLPWVFWRAVDEGTPLSA